MNLISAIASTVGTILGVSSTATANAVQAMFLGLLQGLPDGGGLPLGVHQAAIYFGNDLAKVNFIFPVDTLLTCLLIVITLKMGLWGFHFTLVILNWVRGIPTPTFSGNWLPDDGYATPSERQAKFWGQ